MSTSISDFQNPIDPDKVTTTPGLLPYPHTVGSPAFAPTKQGVIRSTALKVMEEQCDMQMQQIKEQITLLAKQAESLRDRIEISKMIYQSAMGFQPIVGHVYHLYARTEGEFVLSMIGPDEWGRKVPFTFYAASAKLLSDHTWQIVREAQ